MNNSFQPVYKISLKQNSNKSWYVGNVEAEHEDPIKLGAGLQQCMTIATALQIAFNIGHTEDALELSSDIQGGKKIGDKTDSSD